MKTVELPLVEDTEEFGRKLGELVRAGDLLLLAGPLGAGKTAFVRGLARGMGVQGRVSSPTFVVARVHEPAEGRSVRLVHVDAYRLGGHLDELDDLDLDTDLVDAVVAVEWGEGVAERLNDDHLLIRLERGIDDVRTAQLIPQGGWTARTLPV
ncbi:tRNA (adenosine(37)-N6)-threonylcarbamoyltransferase complex ATPase subunit type 1 TsaE [Lentzea pudingi]|uniref:tRNA (adenosine(37)-N6)-threonylcarbamoyltransferase complex ATPase subunit type 1 TsaE n=1 Tax=Lentzea pudingi TaxID=1789439 RepID=UPI001E5FD2DB|nr:tRNA (adenosine(37)-N6)-threonylcarbamoyltransferase complex ATPase subunit type 1 TsaE [Lentzea pudingi]